MARGALVAAGLACVVGGVGALGYGVSRKPTGGMSPQQTQAMTTAIERLDGDVKAARTAVRERATTFAGIPQVQPAIETDEPTAKDMVERGELALQLQPNEVVEIGQLPAGKPPVKLLVLPEHGVRSPHAGVIGSYTELMGDQLLLTDVVEVKPKTAGKDPGYLVVNRPLDLKPSIEPLTAAGLAGRLEVGAGKLGFGTPAAGATDRSTKLVSDPSLAIVVAIPAKAGGTATPVVAVGGAFVALGLILIAIGMTGRRAAATTPVDPPIGTAATKLSTTAAGTPAPHDATGVAITPANLGAGTMIGRWEIVKRLGSGGMADVYLAQSRGEAGFEKLVAIKVMHPHLARNDSAVAHFLDEARLAARIAHPNVVAIQDLGKIGNDYVIVMEYVDGVDLERLLASARLAQRPVPVAVGLGILCRICDGLEAAHRATATDGTPLGVIHRDVKSANVLVSKQGGVKVVDFGIAKAANQAHLTVAGETKGTPSMMAPEQRVGEQVDVRADVYAVAAVGFEILTGHGVNLDLAALAHLGVDNWPHLPLPSSLRPQLPAELDGILLGAMAFARDKRPASCAALEAALEAVMKRHAMNTSDKDIARWVAGELDQLQPPPPRSTAGMA